MATDPAKVDEGTCTSFMAADRGQTTAPGCDGVHDGHLVVAKAGFAKAFEEANGEPRGPVKPGIAGPSGPLRALGRGWRINGFLAV